jgi:hypothetical protein
VRGEKLRGGSVRCDELNQIRPEGRAAHLVLTPTARIVAVVGRLDRGCRRAGLSGMTDPPCGKRYRNEPLYQFVSLRISMAHRDRRAQAWR